MKPILAILVVFGLVATGIGVYFVNKSDSTQTKILAAPETAVLSNILDDCSYVVLPNCPDRMAGVSPLTFVPDEVERILRTHADEKVSTYTESVDPQRFTNLGHPVSLPVKAAYTPAEIIARISLASDIDPRLLIALFRMQGEKAWQGNGSLSNPLGRRELSFADQFAGLALELRQDYHSQIDVPTNSVTNAGTNYPFDQKFVSTASRGLYAYLARTSSPTDFKRYVSLSETQERSFTAIWRSLYGDTTKN